MIREFITKMTVNTMIISEVNKVHLVQWVKLEQLELLVCVEIFQNQVEEITIVS